MQALRKCYGIVGADDIVSEMKTWQVTSNDPHEGLTKWADGLDEAFVQLEPVATTGDGFYGHIQQTSTAELDVSVVTSTGHEIRRLDRHIRHRSADLLYVNILGRGRSEVSQRDTVVAAPMDVSIVDPRAPYSIRQEAPFQLVSIAVPPDWVEREARHCHFLSRTAAGRELSSVVWGLAKMLLAIKPDQDGLATSLAQQIHHSLALLPEMAGSDATPRVSVAMLQSYVQRHFSQPDLRAEHLARQFGISVRRVHQLFEPTGHTVSEFINDLRLARAADCLGDAALARRTISEIAWQVGYSDPSYFTRRFKRRYGCSPRAYRAAHHPAPIARLS
ncbi:helix-turn-helix domain-containing protein [Jannaschia sp. CCS1]|uniref:helix-turn-helix domain-containing protein n=1 Tax=Jannaschia sp. (strain CCS1) TaxID=290400 RepID=UPI000053C7F8|nr:helix-turn-helix domain-containing protein [Jannaschia sp. CCS1]ABD56892.1 transcriptional regulator, AraC family [Jannaschia sp. CCS1]